MRNLDLERLVDNEYTGSLTLHILDGSVTRIERRSEHKVGRASKPASELRARPSPGDPAHGTP